MRRFRLDEFPQLWNVMKGEMSLVGPRPCLFMQEELIKARENIGVLNAIPGITGLAQVSGVTMATPGLLAKTDAQMLDSLCLKNYFYYIFITLSGRMPLRNRAELTKLEYP